MIDFRVRGNVAASREYIGTQVDHCIVRAARNIIFGYLEILLALYIVGLSRLDCGHKITQNTSMIFHFLSHIFKNKNSDHVRVDWISYKYENIYTEGSE